MRRHDLDVFSLVTGLVFVAVAIGHLLDETSDVSFDGRWVVPLVMVAIGVASLAGLARGRGRSSGTADGTDPGPFDGTTAPGSADVPAPDGADTDETLVLHRDEAEER